MRLFSEKVSPTFNSSGYNILTVKDFTEVFFDVYEFEINGSKFVAEKTGVLDDAPIISIPVTYQENVSQYDFVLHRGEQSIHFDPNTKSVPTSLPVHSDTELVLSESTITEEQDEVFLEEKRSVIIEEINKAKVAAAQYISNLDKQNKRSLTKYQTEKELALKEDIDKQKQVLFDEFQSFIENLRNDLLESDASSKEILGQIIISELNEASKQLDTKLESIENAVESKLEERATLLLNDVLLSEIERSSKTISENLDSRVASIEQSLNNSLDETKTQIASNITEKLQEITTELNAKDSSIVELNNTLNKQSNKALSRIGTVKTQLEESLSTAVSLLESRIDSASTKLEEYYNNKISVVEDSMTSLSEETKQHVINLIKESKLSLLEEINNIKVTVPNIVIEKSNGNQEIDVPALKTELEKSVSNRFVNEISSLKRLIELSSGGGSVAMQFANGGTMNGNLTVVGAISASQYLGISIPSGGGGAYLPLSGGTVTGNVTINGAVSAGNLSAGDIYSNGNRVATVVDPVRTTLTGNGTLSTFSISGASGLVNPSALIVAIDGVLQEPSVDYTLSASRITFTSPLPNGSKAVVISPTNTLQVSNMIPADGSVTSAKIAGGVSLSDATMLGTTTLQSVAYSTTQNATDHINTLGLISEPLFQKSFIHTRDYIYNVSNQTNNRYGWTWRAVYTANLTPNANFTKGTRGEILSAGQSYSFTNTSTAGDFISDMTWVAIFRPIGTSPSFSIMRKRSYNAFYTATNGGTVVAQYYPPSGGRALASKIVPTTDYVCMAWSGNNQLTRAGIWHNNTWTSGSHTEGSVTNNGASENLSIGSGQGGAGNGLEFVAFASYAGLLTEQELGILARRFYETHL